MSKDNKLVCFSTYYSLTTERILIKFSGEPVFQAGYFVARQPLSFFKWLRA